MNRLPGCFSRRLVLLVLAIACAGGPGLQAQEPPERVPLDYRRDRGAPMSLRGHDDHFAYLFDTVSVVTGKTWTGLVRVSNPRNGSLVLPALRNDEIVPAFGGLYRVKGGELVRLKDPPKGLAVARDSFVIPLMRDDHGSGQITYPVKDSVGFKTVFLVAVTPGKQPVARVKIDDIRKEAKEVRVGDTLPLGPTEWDVRGIVPGGNGVLGWLELGKKGGK